MSSSQLTFIFFRGVAQPPTSYSCGKIRCFPSTLSPVSASESTPSVGLRPALLCCEGGLAVAGPARIGWCGWVLPVMALYQISTYSWLVVGTFIFFYILGILIPTGSYFSEGLKPPTRQLITPFKECNPIYYQLKLIMARTVGNVRKTNWFCNQTIAVSWVMIGVR